MCETVRYFFTLVAKKLYNLELLGTLSNIANHFQNIANAGSSATAMCDMVMFEMVVLHIAVFFIAVCFIELYLQLKADIVTSVWLPTSTNQLNC